MNHDIKKVVCLIVVLFSGCAITPKPSELNSMQSYQSMSCSQLVNETTLVDQHQQHLKSKASNSDVWGGIGALAMGVMAVVAKDDYTTSQTLINSGTTQSQAASLESQGFNEQSRVLENRKNILNKVMAYKKCS